jgi:hypothetical protein
MSCHSEEIWESFDALSRRMQLLSRQVRELEARLESLEHAEADGLERSLQAKAGSLKES